MDPGITTDTGVPSINIEDFSLRLFDLLRGGTGNIAEHKEEIISAWHDFYYSYVTVSISLSLLLIIMIAYSIFRIHQIRTRENEAIHDAAIWNKPLSAEEDLPLGYRKWQQVEDHAHSGDPSQWRLAILEADIILDEIVFERFGDLGDTLGERLKRVDRSDFQTIDKAWEAHRIRNAIAHEGSSFELSERDLRQTINLYREVFEEFHYI
jgi:hypothetical protein